MSLTKHLADAGSPVHAYLDGVSPTLSNLQGATSEARREADTLGLIELAARETKTPPLPGVDVARAGTAIDFRVRIALGGFNARDSAAALGIAELSLHKFAQGQHRARILTEAFGIAVQILESRSNEADLDRAAILLAHCEQIHRAGIAVLEGSVGSACDLAANGKEFADGLDTPSLADLRSMMESNSTQVDQWRDQIVNGDRFDPNPVFKGSALVGGADADWLIGDVLIESKAYADLTVPKLRGFLRQLLGYVMLDLDDSLRIRSLGVWLPRQGITRAWELETLLGGDPEILLPGLRRGFLAATGGQQIGIRVPVTQLRKHQILADNNHTPSRMLIDLAQSADAGIRFRIGRNARTPETTIRVLAQDRYARVREGVANNENVPTEVLEVLSRDSSAVVRRAAVANPRSPAAPSMSRRAIAVTSQSPEIRSAGGVLIPEDAVMPRLDDGTIVRISQERDDSALEAQLFREFLLLARGGFSPGTSVRIPLPFASQYWARNSEQSMDAPAWLQEGLPEMVKADLMRKDRPAWVRWTVSMTLSVADPTVRDSLLADDDPDVRWSALQRTVDAPDNVLGTLLGELAESRKERIRFRTEGDDQPAWARSPTLAKCDAETLRLVASHPSTPLAALRALMGTKSPDILVKLAENSSLPAEELEALLPRLGAMRSFEPRERLAASNKIPSAAAELLAGDRDTRVRMALAGNEAAPDEVLASLSKGPDAYIRLAVVANPSAPPALAASLARSLLKTSTDEQLLDVLDAVATRGDLDLTEGLLEDALDRLAQSRVRDPDMRQIAADDARAGVQTLERLARSADGLVRGTVAGNSRTPSVTLATLAADPEPQVRAAAARNEALDIALLVLLAYDDEPTVRASAATRPEVGRSLLSELLLDGDISVRSAAFRNPAARIDDLDIARRAWDSAHPAPAPNRADLEERVASSRAEVRVLVAYDRRTPPDILAILGGERASAKVRRAVAAHPNTPGTVLASLANDKDAEVRQSVAFNGATPPEVLVELAGRGIDLALLVAMNPDTPLGIMDALVGDGDPFLGYVAAGARATRAVSAGGEGAGGDAHHKPAPMILPGN